MIVPDYFTGRKDIKVDVHAGRFDRRKPFLVRLYACPQYEEALAHVGSVEERPVAIVKENGHALITSAGGSGAIWVCGSSMNPAQKKVVDELRGVMISLGGGFRDSDDLSFELFPNLVDQL